MRRSQDRAGVGWNREGGMKQEQEFDLGKNMQGRLVPISWSIYVFNNLINLFLNIIIFINFGQTQKMFGKIKVNQESRNNPEKNEENSGKNLQVSAHGGGKQQSMFKTKPIHKAGNGDKDSKKKNIHRQGVNERQSKQEEKRSNHRKQLEDELKGSKFRILNELLYTSTSEKAVEYFREHQEDFQLYHEGFRHQATKWNQNPLHTLIAYLKGIEGISNKLVIDLGCGEGELQEKLSKVSKKVRSFDLVAKKSYVEIADIAHLPINSNSIDFCVFCLSLMGTNYLDFLKEARRVLKNNSELLIAEVESRSKDWQGFIKMIESLGFSCFRNKTNNFFRILYFKSDLTKKDKLKIDNKPVNIESFSQEILTSCLYKKR